MTSPVNLDANASLGLLPEVAALLQEARQSFLNPSSIHQGGQRARALIEDAREDISGLLDLDSDWRVVFTSGATEACNAAVLSPFWAGRSGVSLVTSAVEHPASREAAKRAQHLGAELRVVHPSHLEWRASDFAEKVDSSTLLVSAMMVNNETGQILPVESIAAECRRKNPSVIVFSDAVQAIGKVDLRLRDSEIDMVSISGHKIGALAGVGVLAFRKRVDLTPLIVGGPQELRTRGGTENVIGIVSLGVAARYWRIHQSELRARSHAVCDAFMRELKGLLPWIEENVPAALRVPTTMNLRFPGVPASDLLVGLDIEGVFASAGAACASGKPEPSHVLLALGYDETHARESIRLSCAPFVSSEELSRAARTIARVATRMREAIG